MSIRLILLIIGAVIVLGIIIDGLWRKRRQELIHRSIYQQELKQQQASEIVEPALTEEKHHAVQQIIQEELTEKELIEKELTEKELIEEELIEEEPEKPIDDFIVLTVMAKANQKFSGFELLQALLKSGLKHGEMNIFHRHRDLDNKSPVYFSVASVTKPGYFDIKNMHKCETKGLNIFMSASDVTDPADTFEIMLATAQQLAEKLDGIVCDRHRAVLTQETLAICRSCAKTSR